MTKQQTAEKIAIQWLVRLNSPKLTQQQEDTFFEWLNSSPENQCAYLKAEKLWADSNLYFKARLTSPKPYLWLRPRPMFAMACSVMFILVCATLYFNQNHLPQTLTTMVGQQQQYTLPDGSTVMLNTDSALRITFSNNSRTVYLDKGEAFFSVQKDKHRPFDVVTPNGKVTVVGTQFSVQNKGPDSVVTVIEGKVALGRQTILHNQRITMSEAALGNAPVVVDAVAELSWRKQQLVYRNEELESVIEDLNRYFKEDISLGDASLKSKKVIAVIQLDSLEKTTAVLARALNLEVKIDRAKASVVFTPSTH